MRALATRKGFFVVPADTRRGGGTLNRKYPGACLAVFAVTIGSLSWGLLGVHPVFGTPTAFSAHATYDGRAEGPTSQPSAVCLHSLADALADRNATVLGEDCPSPHIDLVLDDLRTLDSTVTSERDLKKQLDAIWKESKDGIERREQGAFVYQCREKVSPGDAVNHFYAIQRVPPGGPTTVNFDLRLFPLSPVRTRGYAGRGCQLVATLHTHPYEVGEIDAQGNEYIVDAPSANDIAVSAVLGLPGIIMYGDPDSDLRYTTYAFELAPEGDLNARSVTYEYPGEENAGRTQTYSVRPSDGVAERLLWRCGPVSLLDLQPFQPSWSYPERIVIGEEEQRSVIAELRQRARGEVDAEPTPSELEVDPGLLANDPVAGQRLGYTPRYGYVYEGEDGHAQGWLLTYDTARPHLASIVPSPSTPGRYLYPIGQDTLSSSERRWRAGILTNAWSQDVLGSPTLAADILAQLYPYRLHVSPTDFRRPPVLVTYRAGADGALLSGDFFPFLYLEGFFGYKKARTNLLAPLYDGPGNPFSCTHDLDRMGCRYSAVLKRPELIGYEASRVYPPPGKPVWSEAACDERDVVTLLSRDLPASAFSSFMTLVMNDDRAFVLLPSLETLEAQVDPINRCLLTTYDARQPQVGREYNVAHKAAYDRFVQALYGRALPEGHVVSVDTSVEMPDDPDDLKAAEEALVQLAEEVGVVVYRHSGGDSFERLTRHPEPDEDKTETKS